MTDTTKPNGDRDMGPPEGTASSGSTSPPLDMASLRELAKEFGFYPASIKPEDVERHREHNKNADFWLARSHRFDHLKAAHKKSGKTPEGG